MDSWKGRERVKNMLAHLHADQFKGLTQLQVLLMHHNQLQKLPPTLFRDQRKLRVRRTLFINRKQAHVAQ